MRVVTLEEHFTVPSLVRRISREAIARRGFGPRKVPPGRVNPLDLRPRSARCGCGSMDEAGITVQVLSTSGPGADLVDGAEGVAIAREMNDALAEAIARHPDRFAGFAHLPMREPEAAAKELARAVQDARLPRRPHQRHDRGSLPRRSQVRAHPGGGGEPRRADLHPPPPGARGRAQGLLRQSSVQCRRRAGGGRLGLALGDGDPRAAPGRCPARSTGIRSSSSSSVTWARACRSCWRGATRCSRPIPHLARPISQTILDQVWITTSGIFSEPPFLAALLTFGIDRILFSVDYPYAPNARGQAFLQSLSLSPADLAKLAHGNADRLLGSTRRRSETKGPNRGPSLSPHGGRAGRGRTPRPKCGSRLPPETAPRKSRGDRPLLT